MLAWMATQPAFAGPAPPNPIEGRKYLGAASCSSSGCHGGASERSNQNLIWSKLDFHSRSYATLTTARSSRMAEELRIEDATRSARCAGCHAPFHGVAEERRGAGLKTSEGVSCEACHGAGEPWLRGHTRLTRGHAEGEAWTHADCVTAGMRELRTLYSRANNCVACHQTLETDLAKAGHPELIFELDGQAVTMPKHWREGERWSGAQAWLVGQAVALREMSWQMDREPAAADHLAARWSGLLWLLQEVCQTSKTFPALQSIPSEPNREHAAQAQRLCDQLARTASQMEWTPALTKQLLSRLAATGAAFQQDKTPRAVQARRAERLVLALDRLVASLEPATPRKNSAVNPELNALFRQAQSLPDFDPSGFAAALDQLAKKLADTFLAGQSG
jgi:hypothetical protein